MAKSRNSTDFFRIAIASLYSSTASEEWRQSLKDQLIEWPEMARYSHAHGLSPLLYHVVQNDPTIALPGNVHRFLRKYFHETASFNLLAISVLERVLEGLETESVSLIVLKGAALIQSVYDNFALRPMVDLDLLIEFQDRRSTLEVLFMLGFQEQSPEPYSNEHGLFWNETVLVGTDVNRLQIELHWHLIDNPYLAQRLATPRLISRGQVIGTKGQSSRVLSADDQIIHLCIHNTFHHQYQLLRTMVDIAHVVSCYGESINWDRLLRTAELCNLSHSIRTNLNIAASDWYVPIPDEVQRGLQRHGYFVAERFFVVSQRSEFLKLVRTILTLPSLKLKLLFIKGQLLPRREFLLWRYGTSQAESTALLLLRRYNFGFRGLLAEIRAKLPQLRPET